MKAHFEQVRPLPENSFRVFLHEVDEFDAPWHYHPEFELTLILASKGIRYVGNNMGNFSEGDLVLLGPNLPHCWKNTASGQTSGAQESRRPGRASAQPARAIVIQWQEEFLGEKWLERPEFNHISQLLLQARHGARFGREATGKAREMMLQLLELPPFEKLVQLLKVLDFLAGKKDIHLLCEQGVAHSLNIKDNERINIVYNYIREHYRQKTTLRAVAGLVHMNEEAFSRFFSKIMRKPFFTFLNEYRITMATKLLVETDMQVAQVGFSCGYESLPFFYRQFARYINMSPQSYRKKFRAVT